jgi:SNF2 family DNA or RNA helicase
MPPKKGGRRAAPKRAQKTPEAPEAQPAQQQGEEDAFFKPGEAGPAEDEAEEDQFAAAHDVQVDRESLYTTLAPPSATNQNAPEESQTGETGGSGPLDYSLPQPAGMKSQLFGYQRDAVGWLARRERGGVLWHDLNSVSHENNNTGSKKNAVEPLSPERKAELEAQCSMLRGGLLADEMGLGKTLEVIGLVLSHPYDEGEAKQLREAVDDDADLPENIREVREDVPPPDLPLPCFFFRG